MQSKLKFCLAAMLLAFVAGCAATPGSGSHQRDLECPADLDSYCGGWTVYYARIRNPSDHIAKHDQFVIGRKSNGRDPLAIFPRPTLLARWNAQNRIPLREIESGDAHDCMVGRVRLTSHASNPPHEWHALTLRIETVNTPEIGEEETIVMCLEPQEGGGWPGQCAPLNCGEYPDDDDPRNHRGRVHAND